MNGLELTRWTVRLALLCYAGVLTASVAGGGNSGRSRWLWTVGCLLLLAHVACAFHFVHDWQHALAVQATARETEALLGWRFGGGVYFNYAFALLWALDVGWWWLAPGSYQRRSRGLAVAIHGFLFFIVLNGAIVFEDGPTRWFGVAMLLVLLIVAVRRRFGDGKTAAEAPPM